MEIKKLRTMKYYFFLREDEIHENFLHNKIYSLIQIMAPQILNTELELIIIARTLAIRIRKKFKH